MTGDRAIDVSPTRYGTFTTASVLAMYRSSPTSTMPNGELRPVMNAVRVSATPSPLASRSNVMRLALAVAPPAFFMKNFIMAPLMPFPSSGLGGALVSATSTSPLGRTYTQRGWSRPPAKALTDRPCGAVGVAPDGHPTASATFTVGTIKELGGGSCGEVPIPGSRPGEGVPQATIPIAVAIVDTPATSRKHLMPHDRQSFADGL